MENLENILCNKRVIGHILNYLEISDLPNLELTNSGIKSCIDFFYEIKANSLDFFKSDKQQENKIGRKNSKVSKQNFTKYKKNYFSKYLNSLVVFGVNEEFDEEDYNTDKSIFSGFKDEEEKTSKLSNKKNINLTNAKYFKNRLYHSGQNYEDFFPSEYSVKQIFYSNNKLFLLYNTEELKVFPQDSIELFSVPISIFLDRKNFKKILYCEDTSVIFALSEEGIIYKIYYPSQTNVKVFEEYEKEHLSNPYIKKFHTEETKEQNKFSCGSIRLSFDEIIYTDIFLMKNYLVLIDKSYSFYYLNIDNLRTYLQESDKPEAQADLDKNNLDNEGAENDNNHFNNHLEQGKENIIDFAYKGNNDNNNNNTFENFNPKNTEKDDLKKLFVTKDTNHISYEDANNITIINDNLIRLDIEDKTGYEFGKLNSNKNWNIGNNSSDNLSLNKAYEDNLKYDCHNSNRDSIGKSAKTKNNFEESQQTNFSDISVKLNQNYGKIIKVDCSDSNLLFADEEQKLYYIPLSELAKDLIKAPKPVLSDSKLSKISEISCGDGHFMILEREDVPPLETWSEIDVYNWFKEMELDEFLNIIKYEKIKGSDLLKADNTFFLNIMGMEDDIIAKIKYEINKLRSNSSCRSMRLWGWGSNKNGQLAQMDYNKDYLKTLTRINLPEMKEDMDFIVSIKCLKNYSVLLTKFGEIYMTGNYSMKKKSEMSSLFSNSNTTNNERGNNNNYQGNNNNNTYQNTRDSKRNKRERKESNVSSNTNTNAVILKPNNKWVNVTKRICFDVLKEDNSYNEEMRQNLFFKARSLFATNNQLFIFGYKSNSVPFTLQNKLPKLKHLKKGEKFPTSDSVIEKILKKKNVNKDKVVIVYDDAKLKFLETPLLNYIESEVPYHKIIQIKYFNEIIWDRKKRFYRYDY